MVRKKHELFGWKTKIFKNKIIEHQGITNSKSLVITNIEVSYMEWFDHFEMKKKKTLNGKIRTNFFLENNKISIILLTVYL